MATSAAPEERGWQVGQSLQDCLYHMLEEEIGCDITFQIQSPDETVTKISAHKFMLTARSPVFEAMFGGNFAETDQDPVVTDIEPLPFKEILRFIYTDGVKLTGDNVLQILYGAKKYMMTSLEARCTQFLTNEISEQNVASVLTHSLTFGEDALAKRCLEYIQPRTMNVCKTEAFHKMSYDALLKVLKCDNLLVVDEADLFKQSMEWAKRHTEEGCVADDKELRLLLGECLHEIRLMSLTTETFAKKIAPFDVLTGDEKNAFFCYMVTADKIHLDKIQSFGFNMSSRIYRFERFHNQYPTQFSADSPQNQDIFNISFTKSAMLSGFTVYAPPNGTYSDVTITITEPSVGNVGQINTKVTSDNTAQPIRVMLDKAVLMKPDVQYTVTGTNNGYTGYGQSPIDSSDIGSLRVHSDVLQWAGHTYDHYGDDVENRIHDYGYDVENTIHDYDDDVENTSQIQAVLFQVVA